jgi:hypothetical protein
MTDFASQADIINEASADPAPEMPVPPDPHVTLLRGIRQVTDEIDVWHDIAEVRELTGEDEEYLAATAGKAKDGMSFTKYMGTLLQRGVLKIGDLDVQKHPSVIDKLIMADREVLFLAMVKATYGPTRKLRVICGQCGADNTVEIELDEDFKVTEPTFDVRKDMVVQTSKGQVRLRLPNGEDMEAVQSNDKLTDAQVNTLMLARCSVWDPEDAPLDKEAWARKLNVSDRKLLVSRMLEASNFGPNLEGVETQCAECGENMAISLDWVSLLFG